MKETEQKKDLLISQGWSLDSRREILEKVFVLRDFSAAIELINQIAQVAEEQNHHPDFSLTYNKLKIQLTTHDEKRVTTKDFQLAQLIEALSISYKSSYKSKKS